ncbi:MAG: carbohydrate binding family 9 domain-containing protein [Psychrobium sp.]|nr:carbohydrate binding family 9 domain-containing protein [Psychrobium sp.]
MSKIPRSISAAYYTLAVSSIIVSSAAFSANKALKIPHQATPITVDGEMNEAVWKSANKIILSYENSPGDGIAAKVKTVAYFYEDGEHLNVAIVATDPNPSLIRANLSDRDNMFSDDYAGIVIDTFNDKRNAYEFHVNAIGVQGDLRLKDQNGWNGDESWDAIWDSAAKITKTGYVIEMSIPFKALRFPKASGPLTWNIAALRSYPRDHRYRLASYQGNREVKCNICLFDSITGFEQVTPGKNVQLTPTFTINRSDVRETNQQNWTKGDVDMEPGLDLRWGITPDMVFNATLNPDFSQVEADAGQLDVNNTYSLYYAEKRPFFLDGADYFDGERINLVHTRNIASPDYGLKLSGKTGKHTYAGLVANDENTAFLLPGNQGSSLAVLNDKSEIAIARYKMDIGERSSFGGIVTNRQGSNYKNTVVSVDGQHWFNERDSVSYQAAWSDSDNPDSLVKQYFLPKEQSGYIASVGLQRDTKNYTLSANYIDIAKDFRADLGFVKQADYRKAVVGGSYRWYGEDGASISRFGMYSDIDTTQDQAGNTLEKEAQISFNVIGKHQLYAEVGFTTRERLFNQKYFDENQIDAFVQMAPLSSLQVNASMRAGTEVDVANSRLGDILNFSGGFDYKANQHFSIAIEQSFSRLKVNDITEFTAHLTDARASYQFDLKSYLKLVLQYYDVDYAGDVERGLNTQLIYSYKLNPQTLVFLGYADKGVKHGEMTSIRKTGRTVFAKFSYAWQL